MLSRHQVRELDRRAIEELGIPGVLLMENAGRGVVEVLCRLGIDGPVHIICGKGNNAGDGYVIARHLDAVGKQVVVHQCAPAAELTGDAAINYHIIERTGLNIVPFQSIESLKQTFAQAHWIVDALLGTGLTGEVRQPFAGIIDCLNQAGKPILAVDLPSGMDADTGLPLGSCVKALHTVTFVDQKQGFAHPEARRYTGQVHVVDIGIPASLLAQYGITPFASARISA